MTEYLLHLLLKARCCLCLAIFLGIFKQSTLSVCHIIAMSLQCMDLSTSMNTVVIVACTLLMIKDVINKMITFH